MFFISGVLTTIILMDRIMYFSFFTEAHRPPSSWTVEWGLRGSNLEFLSGVCLLCEWS